MTGVRRQGGGEGGAAKRQRVCFSNSPATAADDTSPVAATASPGSEEEDEVLDWSVPADWGDAEENEEDTPLLDNAGEWGEESDSDEGAAEEEERGSTTAVGDSHCVGSDVNRGESPSRATDSNAGKATRDEEREWGGSPSECLSPADIMARQLLLIERVLQVVPGLSPSAAWGLLHHWRWRAEAVLEKWAEEGGESVCARVGVTWSREEMTRSEGVGDGREHSRECGGSSPPQERECELCLECVAAEEWYSPPCQHGACKQCWRRYLAIAVQEQVQGIPCSGRNPDGRKCKALLDQRHVLALLADEDAKRKYLRVRTRCWNTREREIYLDTAIDTETEH